MKIFNYVLLKSQKKNCLESLSSNVFLQKKEKEVRLILIQKIIFQIIMQP